MAACAYAKSVHSDLRRLASSGAAFATLKLAVIVTALGCVAGSPRLATAANTITAANCSQSAVQTAVNSAADGDTVSIPAGSCTWSGGVSWSNKNINVIGAGIGNTVITLTGSAFSVSPTTKAAFRISGMTLTGTPTGDPWVIYINSSNTEDVMKGWRIDHIRFNFTNQTSLRAIMTDGITYGLIDNCIFDGGSYLGVHSRGYTQADWNRGDPMGTKSWSLPLNLGTDEAVYIEDSTWNLVTSGLPFVNDMSFGARQVFRHNVINNAIFQAHSARGNDRGGAVKYEVYNNTWRGNGIYRIAQIRSGTGVIFNNTISGYINNNFDIDDQRASTESGCYEISSPLNRCNGSSSYDGNVESNGWPCLDQIGRGAGAPRNQPSVPLYTWNNGTLATCATGGACDNASIARINGACASSGNWIKTTGSPHTGGVVDYINNGSTPKPGYTPYTYPHPLQQRSATSDTTPPTVAMTAPAEGAAVSGSVSVAANASDNVAVAAVQFKLDGVNLSEDTSAPYSITWNTSASSNGTHVLTAVARDSSGNTTTSAPRTVTVANTLSAPVITTQPNSATVSVGQAATFSVAASGSSPLSYQWQRNGANISGATLSSYSTPPTVLADSGSTYRVRVSNSAGSVTSNSANLTVSAQSGAIGIYNFDEGSGTIANDSSGNNRTGTLINGTTWATGKYGGGLKFDGINDHVTIGNQTLPPSFTLSAWVHNPQNNVYETIASFGTNRQFSITYGSLAFWKGSGSEHRFGAVPTGSWQHVAFTYDGTNLRGYLNGNPLGSPLAISLPSTGGTTLFGAWPNSWGGVEDFLSGRLDDLRIYSRALSQSEIQAIRTTPALTAARSISNVASETPSLLSTQSSTTGTEDQATSRGSSSDGAGSAGTVAGANGELPALLGKTPAEAGSEWTDVGAASGFADAVVIAGPPTFTDDQPGVVRVANVDAAGFEIRFQEWDYLQRAGDAAHGREKIPYLVLKPGRYDMGDGSVWEVGTFLVGGKAWKRVGFKGPLGTAPSLFLTVQTANDPRAVSVRARRVTGEGFEAALLQEQAERDGHGVETVGYLAIKRGAGAGGFIDIGGEEIPYSLQSVSVNHRWVPVLSQRLKLEEEASKDSEQEHPDETVHVLALGQQLFAQQVSNRRSDTTALRRMAPFNGAGLEWGMVRGIDSSWTMLPFAQKFSNPVVVVRSVSEHDPALGVVVLRRSSADGFQLRVQERTDGEATRAKVDAFYMVAEAGRQTLGDLAIEANLLGSSPPAATDAWQRVAFSSPFAAAPVVLSSPQTSNGVTAARTRVAEVTQGSFLTALEYPSGQGQTSEILGWIAIEQGRRVTIDGRGVEAFSKELHDALATVRFPTATNHRHPTVLSDVNGDMDSPPVFLHHVGPTSTQIQLNIADQELTGGATPPMQEWVGIFVGD
jgi:hypothetical protein